MGTCILPYILGKSRGRFGQTWRYCGEDASRLWNSITRSDARVADHQWTKNHYHSLNLYQHDQHEFNNIGSGHSHPWGSSNQVCRAETIAKGRLKLQKNLQSQMGA